MRNDWTTRKLGEVISLAYGKPLPKDQRCEQGGFPAYGANGIKTYSVKPYCDQPSIIVGRKGTAGAVNLVDGGFWPLDVTYYVTFDSNQYDLKFLYYLLSALELPSLATGVKPGINRNIVYAIERCFPPLNEQKRIVAILDEAFMGIDSAIANTEKNLANARELFESYLSSAFLGAGKGWSSERFGSLVEFKNGLNYTKSSKGEKVRIVGVKNFKSDFWVPTEGLAIAQLDGQLSEAFELQEGDILIVRSNGNKELIGRCLLAGPVSQKTSHSGFTIRARLTRNELYPEYLAHFLKSYQARKALVRSGGGANISSLNQKALASLTIPYPSKKDQRKIVVRIAEIESSTQQLERLYQQKLDGLNELRQSLLQKAFSGELTGESAEKEMEEAVA